MEQRRRFKAEFLGVLIQARKRWAGQLAEHRVVVHAHHRDIVGNLDAGPAAGVQQLDSERVVGSHDADGFG